MGADPKLNVAIVAHFAYGAMTGGAQGHVGGVERQTSLLARWLAARGHKVSLLTWNEGQGDEVMIDGVRVISICRADEGIRGLRFFVPRWSGLIRALNRADADVCYHNCAEYVTGQIALWCRMRNRRFVFSVASDIEVEKELGGLESLQERYLKPLLPIKSNGWRTQNPPKMPTKLGVQRNVLRAPHIAAKAKAAKRTG